MAQAPMFETSTQEARRFWIAIAVGALLVVAAVAAAVMFSDRPQPQAEARLDPYAENLQIGALKLSVAQNFMGSNIHYVEGKIANVGGRTVNGIEVEVLFRDSLGQIVLRDTQNLMLLQEGSGDLPADVVSLKKVPLHPNEVRTFRLTFEHLPADWNGGYPELRVIKVSFA